MTQLERNTSQNQVSAIQKKHSMQETLTRMDRSLADHIEFLKAYRDALSGVGISKDTSLNLSRRITNLFESVVKGEVKTAWVNTIVSSHSTVYSKVIDCLHRTFNDAQTALRVDEIKNAFSEELRKFSDSDIRSSSFVDIASLQEQIDSHFLKAKSAELRPNAASNIRASNDIGDLLNAPTNPALSSSSSSINESIGGNSGVASATGIGLSTAAAGGGGTQTSTGTGENDEGDSGTKSKVKAVDQNSSGIMTKIKNIFKRGGEQTTASQVNFDGVSNDFYYCPIKKKYIFSGQEEETILDEPPPMMGSMSSASATASTEMNTQEQDKTGLNVSKENSTSSAAAGSNPLIQPPANNYRSTRDRSKKLKDQLKLKSKEESNSNLVFAPPVEDTVSSENVTVPSGIPVVEQSANQHGSVLGTQQIPNVVPVQQGGLAATTMMNISFDFVQLERKVAEIVEELLGGGMMDCGAVIQNVEEKVAAQMKESLFGVSENIKRMGEVIASREKSIRKQYEKEIMVLRKEYFALLDDRMNEIQIGGKGDNNSNREDSSMIELVEEQRLKMNQLKKSLIEKQFARSQEERKQLGIVKDMVERIHELESRLAASKDQADQHANAIAILAKVDLLKQETNSSILHAKEGRLAAVSEMNVKFAEQIESSHAVITTMRTEITQKNRAIHELTVHNTNLKNISCRNEEALSAKSKQLKEMSKKEQAITEESKRLQGVIAVLEEQLKRKTVEVEEKVMDISYLQEKNENYEQVELNMNEEIVNYQMMFDQFKQTSEETIYSLKKELEELKETHQQVVAEGEVLVNEKGQLEREIEEVRLESEEALANLQVSLEEAKQQSEKLEEEMSLLTKEIDNLIGVLLAFAPTFSNSSESSAKEQIIALSDFIEVTFREWEESKMSNEEQLENLKLELSCEKENIDSLKGEKDLLVIEKDELADKVNNLIQEQEQLAGSIIEMKLEHESALVSSREHAALLEVNVAELKEALLNKENEISQKFDELSELVTKLTAQVAQKDEEISALTASTSEQIQQLQETLAAQTEELLVKKEELSASEAKIEDLLYEKEGMAEYQAQELSGLESQLNEARKELESSEQLKQELRQELESLASLLNEKDISLNSHLEHIESLKANNEQIEQEYHNAIEQLKENRLLIAQENSSKDDSLQELTEKLRIANETISEQLEQLEYNKGAREEWEKKERALKEDIQNLIQQDEDQMNKYANKLIELESQNAEQKEQLEAANAESKEKFESAAAEFWEKLEFATTENARECETLKNRFEQERDELIGRIEELSAELKWARQVREEGGAAEIGGSGMGDDFTDSNGQLANNGSGGSADVDARVREFKERLDHAEVQIMQLKGEVETKENANGLLEKQIKNLHAQNSHFVNQVENLITELKALRVELENSKAETLAAKKDAEEQIDSITDEKRHLKMNFDELLERMNESETFEKVTDLQNQIILLKEEIQRLKDKQKEEQIVVQPASNQLISSKQDIKEIQGKKLEKIDISEGPVPAPPTPVSSKPKIEIPDSNKSSQPPSVQATPTAQKAPQKGGLFNTIAGIFLTEKDRQILENR